MTSNDRITPAELAHAGDAITRITEAFAEKVVGQERLRESLLVGLITGGHVLLESVPGLAKTTAAETLAQSIDGTFRRIQCTPDLLPSDIIGTQIYDAQHGEFRTQLGPVHANLVLLDEINRSSAKTQSAMLEAMQERQTTIGGEQHKLPNPFLVIATQNPIEQEGTYVLAEAQLDRFMLKDVLDYPTPAEEAQVLRRIDEGRFAAPSKPVASLDDVLGVQRMVRRVYLDPAITEYIVSLTYVTRHVDDYLPPELARLVEVGASPRAAIHFAAGARAIALLHGRDHVIPEDVRALGHRILRHRMLLGFEAAATGVKPEQLVDAVFAAVRTP
ncbi:AAA family ATPase [Gulosibacter macacae]|uniref:AAA family ATPase n=1 Tax=Gulosibacter macacae TaxID=2488791 RepID=A0A3P3W4Z7_9MICO|nr:AAA family ATPase [Gulosibacter macacae]RRJ88719.1 AAA family ATPase [Gulosibacter macacae]